MRILQQISIREKLSSLIIASSAFLLMGTMTALWSNPYFIRMTEENVWDYLILSVEALLIGLFFGIRAPSCATKKAGIGGILGFFGFGCSVCNKFLLLLFSSTFILTYFEPVRHYVGVLGILLFSHALLKKLLLRHVVLSENSSMEKLPQVQKNVIKSAKKNHADSICTVFEILLLACRI